MRGILLLPTFVLLALVPVSSAEEPPNAIAYPLGIGVAPEVRAGVGSWTLVEVTVLNPDPVNERRVRMSIVGVELLEEDTGVGETFATRGAGAEEDILVIPPVGEATWKVWVQPGGDGTRWRVTIGAAEDATAPAAPVASFVVDARPSLLASLAPLAGYAAGGAAGAALGAFLLWRPELRGLLALPFVALYHRVARSEALAAERRRWIHDLVRERPGISYADVMRETGLGAGALMHHLRTLERERLVVSRREGRRRFLYVAGARPEEGPATRGPSLDPAGARARDG